MFLRRLGPDPHANGAQTPSLHGCPDIFELESGDFAIIGLDITAHAAIPQLVELLGYFSGSFPEGHPYRNVTAVPGLGYRPAIWMLGSSTYSAQTRG